MMKQILLLLSLLLATFSLSAQNAGSATAISGTVVDVEGNPIPGAKIEIAGTAISVITELDGSFHIEADAPIKKVKALYVGLQSKTQKAEPNMTIVLRKRGSWFSKPARSYWFVGAQGAFPEDGVKNPAFGLMVGRAKTLGWYAKGVFSPGESTDADYVAYPEESDEVSYWTTGESKNSYLAATAGLIANLRCPIYVYAGAGYAQRKAAWKLADGTWAENTEYSYSNVVAEAGLMLRFKWLFVNGGVQIPVGEGCVVGNAGIGICF